MLPPSASAEIPYRLFQARNKTVDEIIEFIRLPQGWHYGQGGPIDARVCIWALQLLARANQMGFTKTEAFPGVGGEVMVSVYTGNHTFDFTIDPDGTVEFRHEIDDDDDVKVVNGLTLEAAKQKLTTVGFAPWNLSGSSILSTSVAKKAHSKTSPSRLAQMAGEYQLLTENVAWQLVNHSVDT